MNNFADQCPGCGVCKEICPFLAEYGTPDRILRECPEVSFYCTSCRRCDAVCPQGLSPSAAFFEVKRGRVRQNRIPSPVRKALGSSRKFAKTGHGLPFSFYESADTVFWPGCGLAANRPGLVRLIRDILGRRLQRPVGLVLDCCYDPVYELGDTGTAFAALKEIGKRLRDHGVRQVITGCLNCHKLLSEHLDEIQVVFVLEALPPEVFGKQRMESIYLHHPCPASRWEEIRNRAKEAVGSLGRDLKSRPIPDLPVSEAPAARCCGVGGGLNALYPDLADRSLDRIIAEGKNRMTVTYCTGCQNRLLQKGVKAIHLLECLPGVKPRRSIPSPLAQWVNRLFLALAARVETGIHYRKQERV